MFPLTNSTILYKDIQIMVNRKTPYDSLLPGEGELEG